MLPSLLVLLVTALVPVFMTVGYSFTDYSILEDGEFVGFDNYTRMFSDPVFTSALRVTIIFTLISVPLQTIGALVLAETLAKRFRNRFGQFTRSVLFIPSIASMVVAGTVWRMLLGDQGLLNEILRGLGLEASNLLGRPTSALIAVSLIAVWANVGYFVVIYYAGILEVPASLYEASALDGAGGFRQFRHITWPGVSASTVVVVVLGTIWSFQTFDLIYVMTGGGPGGATSTLVFAIYRFGFQNFQMGYASAVAVVLLIGVLAISIVQNRLLTRKD
ncbi:carbohydrate ABC transporter permease [Occultella gossypii]|uniref:carbohydrate ABC transporter permease n=1 Tax=Occultella gossypii TaxID=2800820 RepID=UPI001CC0CCDC|nr:sugar ABC transporter permease [Occultella gossypii]